MGTYYRLHLDSSEHPCHLLRVCLFAGSELDQLRLGGVSSKGEACSIEERTLVCWTAFVCRRLFAAHGGYVVCCRKCRFG